MVPRSPNKMEWQKGRIEQSLTQEKHDQKQKTAKGVVGGSSCMCSLSIQPISDKKHVGKNTTRSMKWKEVGHFPSKSLWEHISCACIRRAKKQAE